METFENTYINYQSGFKTYPSFMKYTLTINSVPRHYTFFISLLLHHTWKYITYIFQDNISNYDNQNHHWRVSVFRARLRKSSRCFLELLFPFLEIFVTSGHYYWLKNSSKFHWPLQSGQALRIIKQIIFKYTLSNLSVRINLLSLNINVEDH